MTIFVDIRSILDLSRTEDGAPAFHPRAISALADIALRAGLVLIADSADLGRAGERLSVLRGEGIEFQAVIDRGQVASALDADTARDAPSYVIAPADDGDDLASHDVSVTLHPERDGWLETASRVRLPARRSSIHRETSETSITVDLNLDGSGKSTVDTGLGFFDHMLDQVARHALVDLNVRAVGDLSVDEHHTIEDTAIALGQAFREALGDKQGIERYAFALPMDDALARVALDWSGRNWLVWSVAFQRERIGDVPTEMFHHFFKSFTDAAACNLNISCQGDNEHHKIESVFKAFGRCLRQASVRREGDTNVPSTKGVL